MKLSYFIIKLETIAPVRRFISRINRVNIIIIDYPVYREEILNIIKVKIILAAGL